MINRILRLSDVKMLSGLPRSTLYLRISQGVWTSPVSLGARIVGWPAIEVETLNAARISGKSDDEMRLIVKELERVRKVNSR